MAAGGMGGQGGIGGLMGAAPGGVDPLALVGNLVGQAMAMAMQQQQQGSMGGQGMGGPGVGGRLGPRPGSQALGGGGRGPSLQQGRERDRRGRQVRSSSCYYLRWTWCLLGLLGLLSGPLGGASLDLPISSAAPPLHGAPRSVAAAGRGGLVLQRGRAGTEAGTVRRRGNRLGFWTHAGLSPRAASCVTLASPLLPLVLSRARHISQRDHVCTGGQV